MRRRQFNQQREVARLLQPITIVETKHEERQEVTGQRREEAVLTKKLPQQCKKCGREFVRGVFIHEKYCKGK